jgi:hypothetical protein
MFDFVKFEDRRTSKSNTYSVVQNADGTITLIPVTGDIIAAGTPLTSVTFDPVEHGINEAVIMADILAVQMLQVQRDLANTYAEVGSVTVSTSENYPFNTASATVALKTARNTLDYIVIPYCNETTQGRAIRIKDRQLNGFKVEVEDCPKKGIEIKYFILGGMYNV